MPNSIKKDYYRDVDGSNVCLVYVDGRNTSFGVLASLFNEASKDFPGLDANNVRTIRHSPRPIEGDRMGSKAIIFSGNALHQKLVDVNGLQFRTKETPPAGYRNLGRVLGLQG